MQVQAFACYEIDQVPPKSGWSTVAIKHGSFYIQNTLRSNSKLVELQLYLALHCLVAQTYAAISKAVE